MFQTQRVSRNASILSKKGILENVHLSILTEIQTMCASTNLKGLIILILNHPAKIFPGLTVDSWLCM